MKNFRNFHLKTLIFLVVKFSVYFNRHVLVMRVKVRVDANVEGLTNEGTNRKLYSYIRP